MSIWLEYLRTRSLIVKLVVLAAVVAVPLAVVGPIAGSSHGAAGWAAAATAAGLCLAGAAAALACASCVRDRKNAWKGVLAGMLPRMGIPLGFALFFHVQGGMLAEAGLLIWLVIFYPITLTVETVLSLPANESPLECPGTSQPKECPGASVGNGVDA